MTVAVGATCTGHLPDHRDCFRRRDSAPTAVSLTVTTTQSGLSVSANPSSLSIQQGTQSSTTIATAIRGSFNSQVALAATGCRRYGRMGSNPQSIPAPGAGNSSMTISVGATTATGTYPLTVLPDRRGINLDCTVALTVTSGGGGGNGITATDYPGMGKQPSHFRGSGRLSGKGTFRSSRRLWSGERRSDTVRVKNRWPDGSLKFAIISLVCRGCRRAEPRSLSRNQSTGNNTGYLE